MTQQEDVKIVYDIMLEEFVRQEDPDFMELYDQKLEEVRGMQEMDDLEEEFRKKITDLCAAGKLSNKYNEMIEKAKEIVTSSLSHKWYEEAGDYVKSLREK